MVATAAFSITPSDTANLPGNTTGGIWVGGAGNITLLPVNGSAAITLTAVPAGTLLPIVAQKVFAGGTSATQLVGLR